MTMSLAIRIIPVLLLRNRGLEKSIRFTDYKYVGCAVNAARVFSNRNADELILLDTLATAEGRRPYLDIVQEIADETFMPFTVGGGIRTIDDIWALLKRGADRVAINTAAVEHPELIAAGADRFGSQCMVVSLDVKQRRDGRHEVYTHSGSHATGLDPVETAQQMEASGAGEILLTSIDQDGCLEGYDIGLIRAVADAVSIPVIACGGAGSVQHLAQACYEGHASAAAAGAFFLFYGKRRVVLITYPTDQDLKQFFKEEHVRPKPLAASVDIRLARH
jgi:cyclase